MDAIFHITVLCSPQRLRAVIVVFDFNASLSEAAPLSPILNPVYLKKMEKSGLLMNVIWVVSFVPTTQIELGECWNLVSF